MVQAFTSFINTLLYGICEGVGDPYRTGGFFYGRLRVVKHCGCPRFISFSPMPLLAQALSGDPLERDSILCQARV